MLPNSKKNPLPPKPQKVQHALQARNQGLERFPMAVLPHSEVQSRKKSPRLQIVLETREAFVAEMRWEGVVSRFEGVCV